MPPTNAKKKSRPPPTPGVKCLCEGCRVEFPSKNAVFKHLVDSNGTCLDPSDHAEFLKYVMQQRREKVLILYGYIPAAGEESTVKDGDGVAKLLLEVLASAQQEQEESGDDGDGSDASAAATAADLRLSRSYGNVSRSTDAVAQDGGTPAITEVLTTRLPPLTVTVQEWLDEVNAALRQRLLTQSNNNDAAADTNNNNNPAQIRVFGRKVLPAVAARFNAEMDMSHRRIEYLLPFDFLFSHPDAETTTHNGHKPGTDPFAAACSNLDDFFLKFPSFNEGCFTKQNEYFSRHNKKIEIERPDRETLMYLYRLKKMMQSMTTGIVVVNNKNDQTIAALESELSEQERQRTKKYQKIEKVAEKSNGSTNKEENVETADSSCDPPFPESSALSTSKGQQQPSNKKAKKQNNSKNKKKKEKKGVLRRRRYHNFTPTVMAHEYLAYRRLDRFYHRATLRFDISSGCGDGDGDRQRAKLIQQEDDNDRSKHPFLALSLGGDIFLTGQVFRAVGLFVALARGIIEKDIVDCVFDEAYPHLVPLPAAPLIGMYAGEAYYDRWEGKLKCVLTPRASKHYDPEGGWNDRATIGMVDEWQTTVREHTVQNWLQDGIDADGRLVSEKRWIEEVLEPWAERGREQLAHYRLWKASMENTTTSTTNGDCSKGSALGSSSEKAPLLQLPPLESVDSTVPPLFGKVLSCLREVDASGRWPSTTPKRHLVMVSTSTLR